MKIKSLAMTGMLTVVCFAPFVLSQKAVAEIANVGTSKTFSCSDSESTIRDVKKVLGITIGSASFYIGYQQVSSTNKNPILIRFNSGVKQWCRTDYETTGDDGTGYGLVWDGSSNLYGVFSATGTQTGDNFSRFATNGWINSYGASGGPKVGILAKIDPLDGDVTNATFIIAKKNDGTTNSLVITGLSLPSGGIKITADSWFSPLRYDKSKKTCTGTSPFKYNATLSANLSTASAASVTATPSGSCY